jgi:hypothetical protein
VKIYFSHTSTRIAHLHALGLVLHPDYDLVPLVGLQKQHAPTPGEELLFERAPEWHQLVPLAGLDTGKANNPADLWEQKLAARREQRLAA